MSKRKHAPPAPPSPLEDALQRFAPLLTADDLTRLQIELAKPVPLALRVNPLKAGDPPAAVAKWAAQYDWQVKPVPFCPAGWWVTVFRNAPSQTLEHRTGHFYIQDAASMLPVELFDFDGLDNPLILDLAASPGGKTTHLINRTGDRGLTLANDSSQERIQALRIVLQNWGSLSSVVTHFPGEKFGAWYPETFDRVLLDAPCSMQGLRSTEAHPMRPITEREQSALAKRQARLLQSALQAVKVGGQVVYSTCTLAPEEDEAVLNTLLMLYPGQIQVDDLSARLPAPAPGLTSHQGIPYHPSIANAARLWPHIFSTAGFFAARLTKLEPLECQPEPPPYRPLDRVGYAPVPNRERHALALELERLYQFNLPGWLEANALHLWQREFVYYAFPIAFLEQFSTLPVQAAGIILGERAPDGQFSPSHEWASRVAEQLSTGRLSLAAEQVAGWLRGEDLPGKPACDLPVGAVALVFDDQGRFTGRGKVLSNRLKNLLPRRML